MPPNDRDKLNRIEELKGKLFSKNYQPKIEHRDNFSHLHKRDVPQGWEDETKDAQATNSTERFFMKTSIFKNLFFLSLAFFVLTSIYAGYVFFAGGNTVSNDNIDISILGNNFVAGGDELPLIVGITNKNNSALELVDLIMEYPKGGADDTTIGTERSRISLGTIPAGAVRNENLKVTLLGEQGSVRPIKFSIEYRVEGSNAIFVKDKSFDVTISSTPINISVDAPTEVSSNQNMTLNVKVTQNTTKASSKILFKADYPPGFQFVSSVPTPSLGNNVWSLGDLAPGAEKTIAITGKMIDVVDGEQKVFHMSVGSQSSTDKSLIDVVFNSISQLVTIKKPFISAQLSINGVSGRDYATDTRTPIQGVINWTNNLDTKVNDLEIRAKISGNAVDRKTINAAQGFYNSLNDTIVWDKNSENDFSEVNPGDSGSVNFSVSPLSLFSASGGLLPSPSINIDISISGKQLVSGYAAADLTNSDSAVVHIISDVGLSTKALYYSGAFKNTGSVPPKVEKETTYTIVWSVSNTANSISKAVVQSTLPEWMRFVGTISPVNEDLAYNASTRQITWNIGSIPKGTGITGGNKSVSFQVAFTPSLSQVNSTPIIINDAVLTGHDDFANVDVRVSKGSLRILLQDDSAFPAGGGTVVE